MKDFPSLALSLYRRGFNDDEPENKEVVSTNRDQVTALSKKVAFANRTFFREKLEQNLDADTRERIKEIPEGEYPYIDRYGRVTYFYAQLADKRVLIYQPGTIMFESGVRDGVLGVHSGGDQQNGAILGNGCATFLCRFVATLTMKYEKRAGNDKLDEDVYREVLTNTIKDFALEDASCHGRLLVMLEEPVGLTSDGKLSDTALDLFHAKEILANSGREVTKEGIDEIVAAPVDANGIESIMQLRIEESHFDMVELFCSGTMEIDTVLPQIIEFLVAKNGLVPDAKKANFR